MKHTYTVALMHDYGCGETCDPIAIGVTREVAQSIKRHYDGIIDRRKLWSDFHGTGIYVLMISRENCLNHADFETATENILKGVCKC